MAQQNIVSFIKNFANIGLDLKMDYDTAMNEVHERVKKDIGLDPKKLTDMEKQTIMMLWQRTQVTQEGIADIKTQFNCLSKEEKAKNMEALKILCPEWSKLPKNPDPKALGNFMCKEILGNPNGGICPFYTQTGMKGLEKAATPEILKLFQEKIDPTHIADAKKEFELMSADKKAMFSNFAKPACEEWFKSPEYKNDPTTTGVVVCKDILELSNGLIDMKEFEKAIKSNMLKLFGEKVDPTRIAETKRQYELMTADEKATFSNLMKPTCEEWFKSPEYKNDSKTAGVVMCQDILGFSSVTVANGGASTGSTGTPTGSTTPAPAFYTQIWFFGVCGGVGLLIIVAIVVVVICMKKKKSGGGRGGRGASSTKSMTRVKY